MDGVAAGCGTIHNDQTGEPGGGAGRAKGRAINGLPERLATPSELATPMGYDAGIEIEAGRQGDYYSDKYGDAPSSEMRRAAADAGVVAVFTECRCTQGNSLISIPQMAGWSRHYVERAGARIRRLAARG